MLGLANQILHHRVDVPKNEGVAAKRKRGNRESLLWLHGSQSAGSPPPGRQWVDLCDRSADTFEFHDDEARRNRQYVIRSNHNRAILAAHDNDLSDDSQEAMLHDHIRPAPVIGGSLRPSVA